MTKLRYVRPKSTKLEAGKWTVVFDTMSDFVGEHEFTVAVDSATEVDGARQEHPVEDCIRRARKQVAAGLMIAAQEALAVLSQEDQDDIARNLQKLKDNPKLPLSGVRHPFDV